MSTIASHPHVGADISSVHPNTGEIPTDSEGAEAVNIDSLVRVAGLEPATPDF